MSARLPVYFISHGGGPWSFMDEASRAPYRKLSDAPGEPALAAKVADLIAGAGLPSRLDPGRGFDHGMFTPFKVIYPAADVPIVQLSLLRGLDPALHLALGRAIAPLREQGVLIVGSGLSYHNLREFFSPSGWGPSREFDAWLQDAVVARQGAERSALLAHWHQAPSARAAHPREEHLLPLMAAVGAAEQDPATLSYHEKD